MQNPENEIRDYKPFPVRLRPSKQANNMRRYILFQFCFIRFLLGFVVWQIDKGPTYPGELLI